MNWPLGDAGNGAVHQNFTASKESEQLKFVLPAAEGSGENDYWYDFHQVMHDETKGGIPADAVNSRTTASRASV